MQNENSKYEKLQILAQYSAWNCAFVESYIRSINNADWDVSIVSRGGHIKAIWAYLIVEKFGIKSIEPFQLQPYSSIYLNYPDQQKSQAKIAFEIETLKELILNVEKASAITLALPTDWHNHLGFLKMGFNQTTKYTYTLDLTSDTETLWKNLDSNRRRHIKNAQKSDFLIEQSKNPNPLFLLKEKSNNPLPFTEVEFKEFATNLINEGVAKLFYIRNHQDEVLGAIFTGLESDKTYYITGAQNNKQSNAFSLLMWQVILHSHEHGGVFDFEGSILPGIEEFFRSFGGTLTPYHVVELFPSTWFSVYRKIKRLL